MLAVTAHAMKGDRESCVAAGFDGYVRKPIIVEELLEAIDGVVHAPRLTSLPPPSRPTLRPLSGQPSVTIDVKQVLARAGNDEDLARELMSIFLEEYPAWLQQLRQALSNRDAVALRRTAHTIKGAVDHCGAVHVYDLALTIERLAGNQRLEHVGGAVKALTQTLSDLRPAMQQFVDGGQGEG
jgi:HPt (histidine-containing phosphotransfer) domain-containing protein